MGTRTFLFVDQVGSTEQLTRLGDRTAQQVRRALFDVLREATEVEGGHEVDFTGDGLFCAFDGAVEAVTAAVSMQQLAWTFNGRRPEEQHLAVRIGLNTGEPLESEGGGYFGAAVVVAARLCSAAAPGQILASALVRGLVEPGGVHPFEPIGALQLKGIPEPVESFAVGWQPDTRRAGLPPLLAAAGATPFVGRRAELEAVARSWQDTAEGGRRLVVVSGDSGVGVSRLLVEAAARLRADGASVWAGRGHGPASRLAPWAEAVGGWSASSPRAEVRLALGDKAADLRRLVPDLDQLVPRLPSPAAVDPRAETFLIADAVDELVARWSAVEPLVVVLDALEDADPASLTVLQRVLTSRRPGRLLVLVGYQPAAVGAPRVLAALQDVPSAADLRLTGLPVDDVRALTEAITGEPVTDDSLRAVLAESEGSPYFVVEMARSLKERAITGQVRRAVDRAGELRTDLRLQREEITLALRQLDQLREGIETGNGVRLDPDGTPPAPGACPYRGLLAFEPEDAESFFGRDGLVAELLAAVLSQRWLAVIGPSGSGKSSAVRAGLLPALAGGALPGSGDWVPVVWTPGPDPLGALGVALAERAGGPSARELSERLVTGSLADVLGGPVGGRRPVLVVDQLEELWTTAPEPARDRVLDLLVEAVGNEHLPVLVVVCLRADYFGRAAEHAGFAALLGGSQVVVPPMSTGELRAAVEGPARRAGLVLEPGLAQAVVDDVEGEPGALPLLSTAMLETWERRRGRSLTLAGYAETGGARRAIATLADRALAELTPAEQELARRLLLRLAAPTAAGTDVARPAPLAELVVDEATDRVLTRLAERRLVTVGAATAQVAHEALLREWPRMRAWLEADRDGRRLHQQIATAATQWDAGGRDDDGLLRGARLSAADDWRADHEAELSGPERDFLTASVEGRQRELRRARRTTRRFQLLAVVLVVLLAGAVVATGFAVVSSRNEQQRATEAVARGLAAQTAALAGSQLDTALLLAVEAYRRFPSADTEGALLTALNGARRLTGPATGLPRDALFAGASPDGRTIAVLTAGGRLELHDSTTLRPLGAALATGISHPFYALWMPDGRRLVWSDWDGAHVISAVPGATDRVDFGGGHSPQFGIDSTGTVLAVSAWRGEEGVAPHVRLLEWATRTQLADIPGSASGQAAVRPGAREVLVADDDGGIRRYGFDGVPIGSVAHPASALDGGFDYAPDGRHFLGLTDRTAQVFDADTLQPVAPRMTVTGTSYVSEEWRRDSGAFLITSDDGSISLVDAGSGEVVDRMTGAARVPGATFVDDHRVLSVANGGASTFDLARLTSLGEATTAPLPLGALVPLPDGGALAGQGPDVVVVDEHGVRPELVAHLPVDVGALALSADGRRIAVLGAPSGGGLAHVVVDRATGRASWDVPAQGSADSPLGRVAFSPDGRRLAVGTYDGAVAVLDAGTGRTLVRRPADKIRVGALLWSRDGSVLFEGGHDGVLRRLAPDTLVAAPHAPLLTSERILTDIAASADGRTLAVSAEDGTVHVVDARTGQPVGEPLDSEGSQLQTVAFSPDGRWVTAMSTDGALRVWERATGRAVGPALQAHDADSVGLAWLPDGHLLTASSTGTLVAWDLAPDSWVRRACSLVGHDLGRDLWSRYLPDLPYRSTCTGG